jgi:hypothetical protein
VTRQPPTVVMSMQSFLVNARLAVYVILYVVDGIFDWIISMPAFELYSSMNAGRQHLLNASLVTVTLALCGI